MKVIGAGFGRTGTDSLKEALELLLGAKCYHMREVIQHENHLLQWEQFGENGRTNMDWKALFKEYEAAVDWPACNYYKELMTVFPDAKVILSIRDPDKWFESFQVLVNLQKTIKWLRPFGAKFRRFPKMIANTTWHIFRDLKDREHCKEVFEHHIAEVKAFVPSERLLVFRVQEGWEPLCAFLNVEVPEVPFPHRNTRELFQKEMRGRIKSEMWQSMKTPALLGLGILLWWYFKRRRR